MGQRSRLAATRALAGQQDAGHAVFLVLQDVFRRLQHLGSADRHDTLRIRFDLCQRGAGDKCRADELGGSAQAVARRLGIADVQSDVLPEDKNRIVRELKSKGKIVAMAGDGVNDAPALAEADVGIAMGTGTEVAIQSAGITLVKGDLAGIARARTLSRMTMRNIRQNLVFAFAYNIIGVPIAAGALYPAFGLLLSPMIAAAAMSFSSVSVIANALRLRTAKL